MRRCTFLILTMAFVLVSAGAVYAQTPTSPPVGTCEPGTSEDFLDIGNVQAQILNNGLLFWNGGRPYYEVPKGSGHNAIFSAGLWLGGFVEDELRMAGSTYGPSELWPGPIADINNPPSTCSNYDRLYHVESELNGETQLDVQGRLDLFRSWPADLGAPYADNNGVSGYQPLDGDLPMLYGEQMIWSVMNDVGNEHERFGTAPLGVEVRAAAFAWNELAPLGNTTFYRFTVLNRSSTTIEDFYFGLDMDVDLGAAYDDGAGTDTTLGMLYSYNVDNYDDGSYLENPPAVGYSLIDLDAPGGPETESPPEWTNTIVWSNGGGIQGDPWDARDAYGYMRSIWRDDSPLTYGGDGLGGSTERAMYMYPGDPVTGSYWSLLNQDGAGNAGPGLNIKMAASYGPLTFAAGDTLDFTIAIVWSRGDDHLDSIERLREDMHLIRASADAWTTPRPVEFSDPPEERPVDTGFSAAVFPNPASSSSTLRLETPETMDVRIDVFDLLGRRIHQVVDTRLDAGDRRYALPTLNWPPGVYLVRIQLDHIMETRRLVVMR